ncbi:glycosyltransferase family 9 protein [Fundidesulfovibrio butyratiphilus]
MSQPARVREGRTLVVNLARLGDQLQAQPVFTSLKGDGESTGLVCLENFQGAAGLMRDVDAVYGAPGARFLAELHQAWPRALGSFLEWAGRVRSEFRPARVINLTPSLTGRLLAKALGPEGALGFGLDAFGFGTYSTPWAAMLEASSENRGASPFNLVDLFWKTAHRPDGPRSFRLAPPGRESLDAARALVASTDPPEHSGLVGFQLGASAARRQWPVESFVALGEALWKNRSLLPVLLGGPDEVHLAERYRALSPCPCADLVGRTTLNELAAQVSRLRLLVTNDTGTMHLAAGVGAPVLAIFLSTAQPVDTGPYQAGSCCLEPDMDCHPCPFGQPCPRNESCRQAVTARAVRTLAEGFLDSGRWPELVGQGVRVWELAPDERHFMILRSLSGHGGTDRAVWTGLQRLAWRRFLDGLPPDAEGRGPFPLSEGFRSPLLSALEPARALLGVLQAQAQAVRTTGNKGMRTKFLVTWQRVDGFFAAQPALSALSHLWRHLSQAQGDDLEHFQQFASRVDDLLAFLTSRLAGQG